MCLLESITRKTSHFKSTNFLSYLPVLPVFVLKTSLFLTIFLCFCLLVKKKISYLKPAYLKKIKAFIM